MRTQSMNDAVFVAYSGVPLFSGAAGVGKEAGLRAKADGIKTFLCANHYAAPPLSFEGCRGSADTIGANMPSGRGNVMEHLQEYRLKPIYETRNISSGPGFITPQNIEQVSQLAGRYR